MEESRQLDECICLVQNALPFGYVKILYDKANDCKKPTTFVTGIRKVRSRSYLSAESRTMLLLTRLPPLRYKLTNLQYKLLWKGIALTHRSNLVGNQTRQPLEYGNQGKYISVQFPNSLFTRQL